MNRIYVRICYLEVEVWSLIVPYKNLLCNVYLSTQLFQDPKLLGWLDWIKLEGFVPDPLTKGVRWITVLLPLSLQGELLPEEFNILLLKESDVLFIYSISCIGNKSKNHTQALVIANDNLKPTALGFKLYIKTWIFT